MKKIILATGILFALQNVNAQSSSAKSKTLENKTVSAKADTKQSENVSSNIIKDLLKDKFISDTNNVSFTLNNEEFIVNRKTMDRKVHLTYMEKYKLKKGTTISCSKSTKN